MEQQVNRFSSSVASAMLEALHEPAGLLRTNGRVILANMALQNRLGSNPIGRNVAEFCAADPAETTRYLVRCSGSRDPLVGAIILSGGAHYTARGSLVRVEDNALVLLRLYEPDGRFVRLTSSVKQLNALLRQREHEKARLQEALRDRDLLHRELQHRVKNNMQMLGGLLDAAKRDQSNQAARAALEEASQRFAAVAAAHQSLYHGGNLNSIPAEPLIKEIAQGAISMSRRPAKLHLKIADVPLPNDATTPVALIVNELITNAVKHACTCETSLAVRVTLSEAGGVAELAVQDSGTGLPAPSVWKKSSGLGLVRGLVRQLRGGMSSDQVEGTRFTISFPVGSSREVKDAP